MLTVFRSMWLRLWGRTLPRDAPEKSKRSDIRPFGVRRATAPVRLRAANDNRLPIRQLPVMCDKAYLGLRRPK